MDSQIKNKFHRDVPKIRVCQGDILKDISIASYAGINEQNGGSLFSKINLQYAIAISQDCDLEHDFDFRKKPESNNDKFLSNILILPAYLMNLFKDGKHQGDNIIGEKWGGEVWKSILGNRNPRFHYIKENSNFQVPDLIIDFKQVHTIKRDLLYSKLGELYHVTICELFRENLSHRYSQYLSRIGLPEIT